MCITSLRLNDAKYSAVKMGFRQPSQTCRLQASEKGTSIGPGGLEDVY